MFYFAIFYDCGDFGEFSVTLIVSYFKTFEKQFCIIFSKNKDLCHF